MIYMERLHERKEKLYMYTVNFESHGDAMFNIDIIKNLLNIYM